MGHKETHYVTLCYVRFIVSIPRFFFVYPIIFLSLEEINLTGDLEDGLGESADVAGGDTGDGDTAVLGGVDRVLEIRLC
jgi:hypothetical protein